LSNNQAAADPAPGGVHVAESRRDEQKLWLILFQIKGVRARLNFLAMQRWVCAALALLIGAVAVTFFAAATMGPLTFLIVGLVVIVAAIVGIVRETMLVRANRASPARAAAIADDRAQLAGRLATVLALNDAPKRSSLWAYLIEDTYGRRENYEPSRIEPRWLSRAFYLVLGAILLAVIALPAAQLSQGLQQRMASSGVPMPGQVTADISSLDIRPADPALQPNAQIYADPETLRKLADKLASADNEDSQKRGLSKLLDKARDFADTFQDKLNGIDRSHANPLRMRLTDSHPGQPNSPKNHTSNPGNPSGVNSGGGLAGNSQPGGAGSSQPGAGSGTGQQPPMTSIPPQQADQLASQDAASQAGAGSDQGSNATDNPADANDATADGGSSHGSGSDPSTLFGPVSDQPLGSDSFKIAIEAEPSDESSSHGSPTYVPPRIRVPLNSLQYPDEPLARTAVPDADQDTIKRVFER
jgi:hypothetical protein